MIKYYSIFFLILIGVLFGSCKKEFLDAKPSSSIVTPTSMAEFQSLLDYSTYMNKTGALPQLSSDEYFIVSQTSFDAIPTQTAKNAYLWKKDIFGGETAIFDWNQLYRVVFYSNSVLDGLSKVDTKGADQTDWNNLKGSALFFRAYAFYDLTRNFCPVYKEGSAATDLGIPLKLSSGIDEILQRSTLKETFSQIIGDLNQAVVLLRDDFSTLNRNRPSKSAAYALLARLYLYMGKYDEAEKAADACLAKYSKLSNYNTISTSSATPFTYSADETIFYSTQIIAYTTTTGYTTTNTAIGVMPELLQLYSTNDLRLSIFYGKNSLSNFNVKRGYVGGGNYAFTGLATDEIMLIKAECAARRQDSQVALDILNKLLTNRYKTGAFTPITFISSDATLAQVLLERRKELVWRAIRWSDLKRLNSAGANITLSRTLNGITYTLPPNDPKYIFPIPDDEIALSGIQQNIR